MCPVLLTHRPLAFSLSQCSICRCEFEPEDELRVLPCGHADHAECIDQWLAVNKSCPICCKDIAPPPTHAAAPAMAPAMAQTTTTTTTTTSTPEPMSIASPSGVNAAAGRGLVVDASPKDDTEGDTGEEGSGSEEGLTPDSTPEWEQVAPMPMATTPIGQMPQLVD
jgi:hypothetical protein